MRLRRFIAILLISFANVFILVHAVVPHYHHDGIVCFEASKDDCKSCCDNGTSADCSAKNDKHHTHLDCCDLPQTIERDGRSIQDEFSTLNVVGFDFLVCVCTLNCYSLMPVDDVVVTKYERYSKHVETYTSSYVPSVYGLRAPPANTIL